MVLEENTWKISISELEKSRTFDQKKKMKSSNGNKFDFNFNYFVLSPFSEKMRKLKIPVHKIPF